MSGSRSSDRAPHDQPARQAIVRERSRNVVVIAGAGTGKTKTIIDRAVELLAPQHAEVSPLRIQRMAAITFTRRAAGELRFRLRERLLRELEHASSGNGEQRAAQLREALGNLDSAFIGTIHGFADRLLRLRPVEADLSPAYALMEDETELVRETMHRMRRAAETGSIRRELGRFAEQVDGALIEEAADTLRCAARSGLPIESSADNWFGAPPSLETMFQQMIGSRDVQVELAATPDPGVAQAQQAARKLREMVDKLRGGSDGVRYLRRVAHALRRLEKVTDPAAAVHTVNETFRGFRPFLREFANDNLAIGVYRTINPNASGAWILNQLKGPHCWLAARLVRLVPVVCAMYERVKAEHEVVDYLDLLIKLRNLLRDDLGARRFYQGLLDHIFVDEFQDTDPLQCEVVFYLSERICTADIGAPPASWDQLQLAPGKLTIVGDPKQSIYRFRRADIAMYSTAIERLRAAGALECRLETNFRSGSGLIDFFNQQLSKVLGRQEGVAFDPESGRAHYEDLKAPVDEPAPTALTVAPAVHLLPYAANSDDGLLARDGRAVEAAMWARYIAWLLASDTKVRDPDTGEWHRVRPGDIAILACVTTNLPMLLRELDQFDIEYAARGGTLFLGHPVVRQYLLALRALADPDDGVAQAALLRPPLFALDWGDHVVALRIKDAADPRRARVEQAREIVKRLRKRRLQQSPGATARDLIEQTGLGRSVAVGRNGAQSLAALYEVAAELDRRAALEGLDFDAASERLRGWASRPVFLDAAEPIGGNAVHVLTVHGAKGLEFPVTILWDGFQRFGDSFNSVWRVERSGRAWALSLGSLSVEHPPGNRLLEREKRFGEEEGKRKYYVAATRARDLLAIGLPAAKGKYEYATKTLVEDVDGIGVKTFETYRPARLPTWARQVQPTAAAEIVPDADAQLAVDQEHESFRALVAAASQPLAVPAAVTSDLKVPAAREREPVEEERVRKQRGGRFGAVFGIAVHKALQLLLSYRDMDPLLAVRNAATIAALNGQLDELSGDVERSLLCLRQMGIVAGPNVATEYPLCAWYDGGRLVSGFIDLLFVEPQRITVLDFKTDVPPSGNIEWAYRAYAQQLRAYGELLRLAGMVAERELRLGLLFSADGQVRWLGTSLRDH